MLDQLLQKKKICSFLCVPYSVTMQDNLRLGFSRQTVLAALGQAAVYNEEHSKPPPNIKNPLDEVCFSRMLLVALGSICSIPLETSQLTLLSVLVGCNDC